MSLAITGHSEMEFTSSGRLRQSADALEAHRAPHFKSSRVAVYATASLAMTVPPVDPPEVFEMQFTTNLSLPPVEIGEDGYPI